MDAFHRQARDLADAVTSMPAGSRWFLHCDQDADGLTAAAVTARALAAVGHRFQVRSSRDKTRATYEGLFDIECDGLIVLDKGTSHVRELAEGAKRTGRPVLVIDHHNVLHDGPHEGVHLLNPRSVGLDGSNDASSSTSAVAFALALVGDKAWAWAPIGLVGAIGDWQHMGGWDGWNKRLVAEGVRRGVMARPHRPAFIGMDLADALAQRGPPLPGVHQDHAGATAFLQTIGVPVAGDVETLDQRHQTRLVTGVVLAGLAHGLKPGDLGRLTHESLETARLGGLRKAFRTVDACAREGQTGTGIAFLMGDPAARKEAEAVFGRYHAVLSNALERLREEGTETRTACQVFCVDDPAYTGMVAGLGMTVVVEDTDRPMVVHAPRPDGQVQVSTRGNDRLVKDGLDLGAACRAAGKHIGREGGGHPVAAGIVVDADQVEPFIAALDEALRGQGFLKHA